jgi:hypothetical protein
MLYSDVFDDVDCPEAYSPICCDPGDEDDDSGDNELEDDVEEYEAEEEEAFIVSQGISEDAYSDHVSTHDFFQLLAFLTSIF